jgi:hypothetical protein
MAGGGTSVHAFKSAGSPVTAIASAEGGKQQRQAGASMHGQCREAQVRITKDQRFAQIADMTSFELWPTGEPEFQPKKITQR